MSKLLEKWKQSIRRFEAVAVVMLVVLLGDAAATAALFRRTGVLLHLDMLAVLITTAVFYIFFMPLVAHIAWRDVQRGRADAADFTLMLLLYHVAITAMLKLALAST